MVSLYAVWVPAFAVAHLLGILLLLYSLEQVRIQIYLSLYGKECSVTCTCKCFIAAQRKRDLY